MQKQIEVLKQRLLQLLQLAWQKAAPVVVPAVQRVARQKHVARALAYIEAMPSDRQGLSGSIALHIMVVLYFTLQAIFGHGLPVAADQMGAVAINMEQFIPPPPKKVKIPPVVETESVDPHFIIEKKIEKPKKKEEKKEEKKPQLQASVNPSYLALVRGILEKAKRYPRDAYLNGDTGDVLLWFIINKQGTVLGFRIEKPTNIRSLDQETVALIKRVKGFPPVPPEMGNQDRWEFTIPIRYTLK